MNKFRPILFSTPMVHAILEGRKTQTRRTCKHQFWSHSELVDVNINKEFQKIDRNVSCPYGNIGDVLWVRESWQILLFKDAPTKYLYKANPQHDAMKWKPSIHMPKAACRLFLRIKYVRVERLRDISEADALAEGISVNAHFYYDYMKNGLGFYSSPIQSFFSLWESINGADSLQANPWVWVIEFERIEKPIDFK